MRVSTRVEYGLMAITDIALHSENGGSVSTTEVAERQKISQKYLEQILPLLRQAGLIKAQKGLRGGYRLSRPANKIVIADVLNALDDSILAEMEIPEEEEDGALRGCINECLWGKINKKLSDYAKSVTLGEFLAECREKNTVEWDLYVI
ncbi:MAG: Rrf2 family transcriptional regulator [Lachnospiraceae bacterium]|nr:Rrf2 family transcriptional regulator [Lachnospiraceae bacterium]